MYKAEPKLNRRLCRLAVSLLVGLWAVTPGWVNALPSGDNIVSGTGSVSSAGPDMTIQQDTSKLAIDWDSFSIGAKESVTFNQPDVNSVALNRVIGVDPSIILGKLSGNGQIFLTNPSGVVFGKGSVVDVHGLLATTLDISKQDFLDGNYVFTQGQSLTAVINDGMINARSDPNFPNAPGYVGLLAPAVENNGTIIVADMGSVALASGTEATLDFTGDGLINFVVTAEVSGDVTDPNKKQLNLKNRILNTGTIQANGGQVLLTAKSAGKLIGNVVNHTGLIEAQTVMQKDGKIILSSGGSGTTGLSGDIDLKKGNLVAGGDVVIALTDGDDLNLDPGNPNGKLGGQDIRQISAKNLILKTDGDINVKGIKAIDTAGITNSVIIESGSNINFNTVASVFPALELFAITDINVNVNVTTTKSDFIAVADSENNGVGEFNVAQSPQGPPVVISSARDIDVTAPTINADNDQSFDETRNLILNGNVEGGVPPQPPINPIVTESISQASLGTFLTEFFENGGPGGC
jgi:filamentous hemagglutinin family protein